MVYYFGECILDEERYELRRAGAVVAIEPKVFQVLVYLIQHRDRMVTRDELLEHCWPDTFVSDSALTQCLARVRKAVGEQRGGSPLVKTVHGHGYRLVAPLLTDAGCAAPPVGASQPQAGVGTRPPASAQPPPPSEVPQEHLEMPPPPVGTPLAEHRSLTVLCAELVDVARLTDQGDPEALHTVVQAFHTTGTEVIHSFEGYIAHYLSDGLVAYCGYPQAHEDDVQRSIRAGLHIVKALQPQPTAAAQGPGTVRIGIHTGPVVIGESGGGRHDPLAVGGTLTIAARLKDLAAPGTVVISATTARLVEGYFLWQAKEVPPLPGGQPDLVAYDVLGESTARSWLEVVAQRRGLTPFVGREAEMAVLRERWEQVKEGMGQVVLLHGEAGIGKSRLVQRLMEQIADQPHTRCECRGSPYHRHSAWYPVTDLLTRILGLDKSAAPDDKLRQLERFVGQAPLALAETVPLFAALLALPLPAEGYPSLGLSPQQQHRKTLEALLACILAYAAQQPVLLIVEDAQWIDPSTLELLSLLIDQGPTARLLLCVVCRPEFRAPWGVRAHVTPLVLNRLPRSQVADMIGRITGGKPFPPEVVQQLLAKTDGVPLFVEELTKMVLESGWIREVQGRYELTGPLPALAIPTTLHDSLMARLVRLGTARGVVQLGAVLGRQFALELLQAVSRLEAEIVQRELSKAVAAEFLYQQGLPPHATYVFKHDLIRETAYQALLKRTRQQYHQRTAQVLEQHFPETVATQPELLAHHYTEAGLTAPAIDYWIRAGQRARERSAHVEAIVHCSMGLQLLPILSETPKRAQDELTLSLLLGASLMVTEGHGAPEVGQVYARARALCHQVGDTPQLARVLYGLWAFYINRTEYREAGELGEQLLALAQRMEHAPSLLIAHNALGTTLIFLGEFTRARTHLEQGIALSIPQLYHSQPVSVPIVSRVTNYAYVASILWILGYPDQALQRSRQALALAQELKHPFSRAMALTWAAVLHQLRREEQAVRQYAAAALVLATEQGFATYTAAGMILRGWGLVQRDRSEERVRQISQGLEAWQAAGSENFHYWSALLAEAYGHNGQVGEGLAQLAKALAAMDRSGEGLWEAELHRLKGVLLLKQPDPDEQQTATCFRHALDIARRQQAKSLELRAAMSLARLWQHQGKRTEARELLAPVYGWFTEGFDTADLQEAQALLDALA